MTRPDDTGDLARSLEGLLRIYTFPDAINKEMTESIIAVYARDLRPVK